MSGRDRGASNHEARVTIPLLVMAGDKREARLRARCPGHPRLSCGDKARTWMPGTSPGTTVKARRAEFVEADQADLGCPVPFAKTFRFRSDPNQNYKPRHPVPPEGRIAIVTDVGHGMRWTRLVLLTNGADADGEVVWS